MQKVGRVLRSSGEDVLNLPSAQGEVEDAYLINIAVEPQLTAAPVGADIELLLWQGIRDGLRLHTMSRTSFPPSNCISITNVLQVRSALDVRARVARDCLQILVDCPQIVVRHVLIHWPWHDL
jgi:hypothetical protein